MAKFFFEWETGPGRLAAHVSRDAQRSRSRGRDGLTARKYADSLTVEDLSRQSALLQSGDWRFVAYREHLVVKTRTQPPRQLSVPSARDRAPLRAVNSFLRATVGAARRPVSQQVIREVVGTLRSTSYEYYTRLDIRAFYPNVQHDALFRAIDSHVPLDAARAFLKGALKNATVADGSATPKLGNTRGIPQGLPVSNSLAELVLFSFDEEWKAHTDIAYFRYADDLLFLTKNPHHDYIFAKVSELLESAGVEPHPFEQSGAKSGFGRLSSGIDYLGYRVGSDRISVRDESIRNLKRAISGLFHRYAKRLRDEDSNHHRQAQFELQWALNLRISGCIFDSERRGWLHYFSLIDDFSLLNELDYFVQQKLAHCGAPELEIKSFKKSFRILARSSTDSSGYIPNLDDAPPKEQFDILRDAFGVPLWQLERWDSDQIRAEYTRRVRGEVAALERDLTPIY